MLNNFNTIMSDSGAKTKKLQLTQTDEYKKLVDSFAEVDKKYSTKYVEPETNLPLSTGQSKIEYVMPTQDELLSMAAASVANKYAVKADNIATQASKNYDTISNSIDSAKVSAALKIDSLNADKSDALKAVKNKAIDNNVARGSILPSMIEANDKAYEAKTEQANASSDAKIGLLEQKLAQNRQQMQKALDALSASESLDAQSTAQKLLSSALKEQTAALKYNNAIDKAESELALKRQEALAKATAKEKARQAQAQELLDAVGSEGVRYYVELDKFKAAKQYFDTLSASEGAEILSLDNSLRDYLGDFYDSLVEYVKSKKG